MTLRRVVLRILFFCVFGAAIALWDEYTAIAGFLLGLALGCVRLNWERDE